MRTRLCHIGNWTSGRLMPCVVMSLSAFVFLLFSCVSLDCPVNNTVECYYSLEKSTGGTDTLGVDTLWVSSPLNDENDEVVLVNRLCGSKATKFSIPVSHTKPMDLVCLLVKDTIGTEWLDTIRVYKENYPHFESVDCKASYFHKLTGISSTNRIIDSVSIIKQEINYDASTPHIVLRLKARR